MDFPRLFSPTDIVSFPLYPALRSRYRFVPTQIAAAGEAPEPAFYIIDTTLPFPSRIVAPNGQYVFPAADTDGDGIAD